MKKWLFICVAITGLLLSGCRHYSNPSMESNLVTKIIITGQTDTETIHRYYDTPEKMRQVLLYIRSVRRGFQAQVDPTTIDGRSVCITTISADDTQKVYQQKDNQYFQIDTGVWQQIEAERGEKLWELIRQLPSDPE